MHETDLFLSFIIFQSFVLGDGTSPKQDPSLALAHACTLWKYHDNTTNECQCGSNLTNAIRCSKKEDMISIKICSCMTFDNTSLDPVVMGNCLYSCHYLHLTSANSVFYEIGTNSTSVLNSVTCGPYNRGGVMCGECIEGHSLPVYSYSLSCVDCTHYKYNWIKYIAVAYIPLTVFLIVVITFRISATSGSMVGYVSVSQLVATYTLSKLYLAISHKAKWAVLVYSIWNLDFFRSIYPPFCIHPHMSALQVASLDYIIAVYPMIMILLTYGIVNLHDRYSQVIWLCGPLYRCFRHIRKEWEIGSSLIGAFATMFLLSYVKILNVTSNILTPYSFNYMNGSQSRYHVQIDINTLYLSTTHLPYFILALTMSFVFNIVPLLLLCLYPCCCFQRCLNHTGLQHQALHIFMDAFQGCYKHNPYNFTTLYMFVQIINVGIPPLLGISQYHSFTSYLLMGIVILLGIARPYRNKWHNVINITVFTSIFIFYFSLTTLFEQIYFHGIRDNSYYHYFCTSIYVMVLFIPPFYGSLLFFRAVMPSKMKKVIATRKKEDTEHHSVINEEFTSLIN